MSSNPSDTVYTAITFAPVQGFIEKSRKLRDLYGSSYLLSFLSSSVCISAKLTSEEEDPVISPANPNIVQGLPNVILIKKNLPEVIARGWFEQAWLCIVQTCRKWIEDNVKGDWDYCWSRTWGAWEKYTWEFFYTSLIESKITNQLSEVEALQMVRHKLSEVKRARAWTAVNWSGESSSLSGSDAIAYPELEVAYNPDYSREDYNKKLEAFYTELQFKLGDRFVEQTPDLRQRLKNRKLSPDEYRIQCIEYGSAFLDEREKLSIPELIKRLITHKDIVINLQENLLHSFSKLLKQSCSLEQRSNLEEELKNIFKDLQKMIEQDLSGDLNPESYRELSRQPQKQDITQRNGWSGWFMGDGDNARVLLSQLSESETKKFSEKMRSWGRELKLNESRYLEQKGRIIYAGGDDFLGIIYESKLDEYMQKCLPSYCLDWFIHFKSQIWEGLIDPRDQKPIVPPITPSVGLVWAAPKIPQRDILQHCREAEKTAKQVGKDRIAIRILFNGGNTLEWTCPWWFLDVFTDYRDRNQVQGIKANWNHIFEDITTLETRHAFRGNTNVALALFELYFGKAKAQDLQDEAQRWNRDGHTGILGDGDRFPTDQSKQKALNDWIINLAKVGFHLHREKPEAASSDEPQGDRAHKPQAA